MLSVQLSLHAERRQLFRRRDVLQPHDHGGDLRRKPRAFGDSHVAKRPVGCPYVRRCRRDGSACHHYAAARQGRLAFSGRDVPTDLAAGV
jgi:hypothetical protein